MPSSPKHNTLTCRLQCARGRRYLHEIVTFPRMDARLARSHRLWYAWRACAVPTRAGRSRRRHRVLQSRGRSTGVARPAPRCREFNPNPKRLSSSLTSTSTAPLTRCTRRSPTPAQQYVRADTLRSFPARRTDEPAYVPREHPRAARWQYVFSSLLRTLHADNTPSGLARR
jgi:hypothetical protein